MSYSPATDFIALLRQTGSEVELARMPGLDYTLSALARAGLFALSIGQTEPIVNQPTTVWLQPAVPTWTAEGVVRLWNAFTGAYEVATPDLWNALLQGVAYTFQSATAVSNSVDARTSLLAIQRATPSTTALILPTVVSRNGKELQIVDWSTAVTNHVITLRPSTGQTIMRLATWQLRSTADQLAGITLYPSTDLNGWVIAP
jgi:hypothetical protein